MAPPTSDPSATDDDGLIIAIDGYSACGKSTLAKALAADLGYAYIDTGAMYRAVTHYFLENQIELDDAAAVDHALAHISIDFRPGPDGNHTYLNDIDVSSEIRGLAVSRLVSPVAAIPAVRRAMVAQQRRMGERGRVVMDGRDIGTVVFPDADLKLFVTADLEERVRRRTTELREKGKQVAEASVRENLSERDHIDSTRADSPLRRAADAVLIDNTRLNRTEQLELAKRLVTEQLAKGRE
jgi:cytidylate kinase